jgi:hypothetical protein
MGLSLRGKRSYSGVCRPDNTNFRLKRANKIYKIVTTNADIPNIYLRHTDSLKKRLFRPDEKSYFFGFFDQKIYIKTKWNSLKNVNISLTGRTAQL